MTNTILIAFLVCTLSVITVSETFVSSGQGTVVSSGTLTVSTYPYSTVFPVSTAQWIWNQNWKNSPAG